MPADAVVEREVHIDAPPDVVFDYLIDPAKQPEWMGVDAEIDPRQGGVYRVRILPGGTIRGTIVEIEPPHRLVVSWGWEEAWSPLRPGASEVQMTLHAEGSGTVLRVRHSGLSEDLARFHGEGWDHYLPRLAEVAAGRGAGPDPWLETGPPRQAFDRIARR